MYDCKLGWKGLKNFMAYYKAVAENLRGGGIVGCLTTLSVIDCGASNCRMSDEAEMIRKKLDVT
jgi:hypothetical protein